MLTNSAKALTTHPNISEVFHGLLHHREAGHDIFQVKTRLDGIIGLFSEEMRKTARDLYRVPTVVELYRRRKEFDLLVVDYLYCEVCWFFIVVRFVSFIAVWLFVWEGLGVGEVVYTSVCHFVCLSVFSCHSLHQVSLPFTHEIPFVTVHTSMIMLEHSALYGNVFSPSFLCEVCDSIFLKAAWTRLINIFTEFSFYFLNKIWVIAPKIQKEVSDVHYLLLEVNC